MNLEGKKRKGKKKVSTAGTNAPEGNSSGNPPSAKRKKAKAKR